jgi:hypothetical protein
MEGLNMIKQNETKQNEKLNCQRVLCAIIYLFIGVQLLLFLYCCHREEMFFVKSEMTGWDYFYRFLWCLTFASFGLACIAFYWRHKETSPWPAYLTFYSPQLLAIASLITGLLHIWEGTSEYPLFYYLSGSLCFMFGLWIDNLPKLVSNILKGR